MKIIGVIFCCARDADKLTWARASLTRLGIETVVVSDPVSPVPGIPPLDNVPFANGITLAGTGAPQACVDKMLKVSEGYDAVLKLDADTLLLERWWEALDPLVEMEGLKRSRRHPDDPWSISGACYLIQRAALEQITGHGLLSEGGEDERITFAVHDKGMTARAPLYRFPYPRGLAFWAFGPSADDWKYAGAKAILFGLRDGQRTEADITKAMSEYAQWKLGIKL